MQANVTGITINQLREKTRDRGILAVRKLVSFTASEFGYRGKEIALFLQKDPSVVTRYLKDREKFKADMEHILKLLND